MALAFPKIKTLKLSNLFWGFWRLFWNHPSLVMILLLALAWGLGSWLFSEYYFKTREQSVNISRIVKIDSHLLEVASTEWQRREQVLETLEKKVYLDPFVLDDFKLPARQATPQPIGFPAAVATSTGTSTSTP